MKIESNNLFAQQQFEVRIQQETAKELSVRRNGLEENPIFPFLLFCDYEFMNYGSHFS